MANILQRTFSNGFSFKKLLSVCAFHIFSLCSHHGIIMKFSGVISNDRRYVYAQVQGQMWKVKVLYTEVKNQISRFRTITSVWFHIWWWNDAQSLILFRSGALLIFKVICQISRLHGLKKSSISTPIGHFRTVSPVSNHRWLWNDA